VAAAPPRRLPGKRLTALMFDRRGDVAMAGFGLFLSVGAGLLIARL